MTKQQLSPIRTYRSKDTPYNKAMNRAQKENASLATLIAYFVDAYGSGKKITVSYKKQGKTIHSVIGKN